MEGYGDGDGSKAVVEVFAEMIVMNDCGYGFT